MLTASGGPLSTYDRRALEGSVSTKRELGIEAFGVRIAVVVEDPAFFAQVEAVLPPHASPCDPGGAEHRIEVTNGPEGRYYVTGEYAIRGDLPLALELLEHELRTCVATNAADVFVHAGAVAKDDKAIIVPGASFSGKTRLVAALVDAGATYYSDEYAVLDADGFVHPYAKPLSIRADGPRQVSHAVASLGGIVGEDQVRVGLVAVASYRPDARWEPERLTPGEAVLEVMSHAVPARDRPAETMRAVRNAIEGAAVMKGERGEAAEVAQALLDELDRVS